MIIEIAIGVGCVAMGSITTSGYSFLKKKAKKGKHKQLCPWPYCGAPLADTPLYNTIGSKYHSDVFFAEKCDVCSNLVAWHADKSTYVRYLKP